MHAIRQVDKNFPLIHTRLKANEYRYFACHRRIDMAHAQLEINRHILLFYSAASVCRKTHKLYKVTQLLPYWINLKWNSAWL